MESSLARDLFSRYSAAMAYVEVETPSGKRHIGSAFHVGEGVFVTARHVVEGVRIREVTPTVYAHVDLDDTEAKEATSFVIIEGDRRPVRRLEHGRLHLDCGPVVHPNPDVDVAAFTVGGLDAKTPWVPLGSHLDDWIGQRDFVLSEVLVLGYPPIPFVGAPHLIAMRAEVNANLDLTIIPHVHFIVSGTPRGGFSGGVALSEWGYALGLVTSGLSRDEQPAELGFFAVIGVEPIYACLSSHKLLPVCQAEGWDDFWNSDHEYFALPGADKDLPTLPPGASGGVVRASLSVFDDGSRIYVEVTCDTPQLLRSLVDKATIEMAPYPLMHRQIRAGMERIVVDGIPPDSEIRLSVERARESIREQLIQHGYVVLGSS